MDKLLRDKKAIVVFVAPAFLLFTFVLFIPICQSVYYSFCEYNALTKPELIRKLQTVVYHRQNHENCVEELVILSCFFSGDTVDCRSDSGGTSDKH